VSSNSHIVAQARRINGVYVCICHAITDRDVEDAKEQGVSRMSEVFSHFGVEPSCGRCCGTIGKMIGSCSRSTDGKCQGHGAALSIETMSDPASFADL